MLELGKYRTSSYLIDVELENNNQCILIHGYTGAIDLVSVELVSFLKREHDFFSKKSLPCSVEMADLLEKRGYITSRTKDEEYQYVERLAKALHKKVQMLPVSFTFVVSYGCNFRCPYCFETNKENNIAFTHKMVDKAFLAISEIQPEERLRSKMFTLYGGEPLLKENKEIVEYILSKGKKLNIKFKVVTNGYDLDVYKDLLSPDIISSLQITVDGTRNIHDKKRIHRDGFVTFDKIVSNIGLALQRGVFVTVRVNTDRSNLKDIPELEKMLKYMYPQHEDKFKVYSAILHDYGVDKKDSDFFSQTDFVKAQQQFDFRYGCEDCGVMKNVYRAVSEKKPLMLKSIYCGAQANSYVLDPLGKIFACWEVVGKNGFEIGDYSGPSIQWKKDMLEKWRGHDILTIEPCHHCKYALLCGGGCADKNLSQLNYCTHLPVILKYAIDMALKKRNIIV